MCTGTAKFYTSCSHKRVFFAKKCILLELPLSQGSDPGGQIHSYLCPVGTWLNDPVKMSGFCDFCTLKETLKENMKKDREEKRKGVEKWIEDFEPTTLIRRVVPEHKLISKAIDKEEKHQVVNNLKQFMAIGANSGAVKEGDGGFGILLDKRDCGFPAFKEGSVAPVVEAGTETAVDEDEDYENIGSDEEWSLVEPAEFA